MSDACKTPRTDENVNTYEWNRSASYRKVVDRSRTLERELTAAQTMIEQKQRGLDAAEGDRHKATKDAAALQLRCAEREIELTAVRQQLAESRALVEDKELLDWLNDWLEKVDWDSFSSVRDAIRAARATATKPLGTDPRTGNQTV